MATTSANATVHTGVNPGWWVPQEGLPLVVPVPQPVAGAEWTWTGPTDRLLSLSTVYGKLVSSTTAGVRRPSLVIKNRNDTVLARIDATATQGATKTHHWTWAKGVTNTVATTVGLLLPLPDIMLPGASTISVTTVAIAATDQWETVALLVKLY